VTDHVVGPAGDGEGVLRRLFERDARDQHGIDVVVGRRLWWWRRRASDRR
jgi:hypothetical protein